MRALGFFSFLFFSLSLFCQEICLISAFCICCHDYSLSLPLPSLPLVFTYICLPGACMHEICLACVDMNAKMITRLKNITGETNRRRKLGQNADDLTSFHLHASLCSCINMCHKKWNQSTCTLHSVPVSICAKKVKSSHLHASLCSCINVCHKNVKSSHLHASLCSCINMCHKNVKSFCMHASLCCCIHYVYKKQKSTCFA